MQDLTQLEQLVDKVETRLASLGEALRVHHADAVATEAAELQRALAAAVEQLRHSARSGPLPLPLRQRLARATGHVAAQRESLARASASLDRAIDVLLPGNTERAAYSANGMAERAALGGMIRA